MVTETMREHRGSSAERDGADVSVGRPVLVHHVVARQGDKGLEVLRIPPTGEGRDVAGVYRWVGRPWLPIRRTVRWGVVRAGVHTR
jgi:hypothetical protein